MFAQKHTTKNSQRRILEKKKKEKEKTQAQQTFVCRKVSAWKLNQR